MHSFQDDLITASLFNPKLLNMPYAWCGHLPFAAWIMKSYAPNIFVELGTHTGNSYFSFCQSVLESNLDSQCFAVDTWQGDEHAGNYDNQIYLQVHQNNQENYSRFSNLMRMTFDEATDSFKNESIELLHIDGLHTYEAVKHDFETWLPKLKPGAIVLFHDTNVYQKDFGVWKYWKELQNKYPNNLEFFHSHGLGVLQIEGVAVGKDTSWLVANTPQKKQILEYFTNLGVTQLDRCELIEIRKQQKELESNMATCHTSMNSLNQLAHERYMQIVALQDAVQQLTEQRQINHQELNGLHQELNSSHQRLLDIFKSNSWRLTRPLRFASSIFKRIF
jgi:hypothetical protein